jgi:hypothetical protein
MDDLLKVRRISLSKNVLRALEVNQDIPLLQEYPRAHQVGTDLFIALLQSLTSHQVTYRYYLGMLSFLNEDYAKVRCYTLTPSPFIEIESSLSKN